MAWFHEKLWEEGWIRIIKEARHPPLSLPFPYEKIRVSQWNSWPIHVGISGVETRAYSPSPPINSPNAE